MTKANTPATLTSQPITVKHIKISSERSFAEVRRRLENTLPKLDASIAEVLRSGDQKGAMVVGSIHALLTTVYGWLLIFKLILFGILISFGARNRLAIKRTPSTGQTSRDLLQFRHNVIWEACLAAAVLTVVACLGVTPPAGHP